MRYILSQDNVDVLAKLVCTRVLLGFDFDGTLAPIVDNRGGAKMRSRTSQLFTKVCVLYPCAVISGRSRGDVAKRLGGAAARYVVGNHGVEPNVGIGAFEEDVATARLRLGEVLASVPGVEIEDKRYSLSIHYRRCENRQAARALIHQAVTDLKLPLRVVAGKMVVNIVPDRAPNKGDALRQLRAEEQAESALYVGDDVTDEDVFALGSSERVVTIRVGVSSSSRARYYLRTQKEIDPLLARLVELRERQSVA